MVSMDLKYDNEISYTCNTIHWQFTNTDKGQVLFGSTHKHGN